MRRGKKTTGRIVVSALGFGVAYYFDTENGARRRKRLHQTVQRAARDISARCWRPKPGTRQPVFHPVLRATEAEGRPCGWRSGASRAPVR